MPADRQNRYLTLFDSSRGPRNAQESAEGRRQGWRDGVELWRQNPMFGVGPGAFGEARESEFKGLQAHNLYGQVIGELGSLGALSLACILGSVLLNWRDARQLVRIMPHLRQSFAYHVILASAATFGLLLLQGLTSHNIYRYTWLWMGAFQTVALACLKKEFSQEAIGAAADENAEYEPAPIACLSA
jgi:O-antigen ligase